MKQNHIMGRMDYLKLHISVILAGFTGLFAKLVSLNEVVIVWYRLLFAFFIFTGILFFIKKKPLQDFKIATKIGSLGALLAIHLIFFFASIKYSNVSIGVVCYSLVGFFTVLFEPLILKTKFSFSELFYSLIAVFGIWLIFSFDTSYRLGIILGIVSAGLFALYTLLNKILEIGKSSYDMLYYELFGGTIFMGLFLSIFLIFNKGLILIPSTIDFVWLLVLAIFCTVILYLFHISALKTLSAFTVSIAGNLEPIYGILFAILFLNEAHELSLSFYIGMILILSSVFLQSFIKNKLLKAHKKSSI